MESSENVRLRAKCEGCDPSFQTENVVNLQFSKPKPSPENTCIHVAFCTIKSVCLSFKLSLIYFTKAMTESLKLVNAPQSTCKQMKQTEMLTDSGRLLLKEKKLKTHPQPLR